MDYGIFNLHTWSFLCMHMCTDPPTASQHNIFDSEKLNFLVLLNGVQTSGDWVLSLTTTNSQLPHHPNPRMQGERDKSRACSCAFHFQVFLRSALWYPFFCAVPAMKAGRGTRHTEVGCGLLPLPRSLRQKKLLRWRITIDSSTKVRSLNTYHMWPFRPKGVELLLGHFLGTANFPKGGALILIMGFQWNQFVQSSFFFT